MTAGNPLVPSANWGAGVEDPWGGAEQKRQVILCWPCVHAGMTDPPDQVVVAGGVSYCLAHAVPGSVAT